MLVVSYYRPDKMRMYDCLNIIKKSAIHSSKCITYKMSKEEIDNYLNTKYKNKIRRYYGTNNKNIN